MTDILARLTTSLADRYVIERELGAGGMATVYLAHDVRHDRKVALKVLRPELAAILGGARFLAEIKTTANLQHPHILGLFDSGEADGAVFYVMPYVDGESLRDRLNREKQLPVDEAVRIAKEVASALDYAHRHSVVHRDIKPENILLHDGTALVADFGIALAASRSDGGTRMTETGMSLGTPHYMAPEQAMGEREITPKADIYALGCVLYEMLTAEPPFTGATAQAIIARVMTEQPRSLTLQRHTIPPHVEMVVRKALEKLPADRFASAAELAAALSNPAYTLSGLASPTGALARAPARRSPLTIGAAGVALAASLLAVWFATRPAPEIPARQFSLALPATQRLGAAAISRVALSPDGSSFAYVGSDVDGVDRLMLRPFGQLRAVTLPGTENGVSPAFSPDGSRIAFLGLAPFALKVVAVNGAPAITLVTENVIGGGVAWSADDWIYFDGGSSLDRVRGGGGARETVIALDSTANEVGFAWPEPLPNGKGLIYRSRRAGDAAQRYVLKVVDLQTRESKVLVQGLVGRYSPSGHLLYVTADGVLLAAPFDQDRMELTGSPTPLIEGIGISGFGSVDLALSAAGDLLFVRANTRGGARLAWVRRNASAAPVDPGWTTGMEEVASWALSPDGRRLALAIGGNSGPGSSSDIWIKELDEGPMSKLTFDGVNHFPTWSADGRSIYYGHAPAGNQAPILQLHRIRADGTGAPEPLLTTPLGVEFISASSRDGWVVVGAGSADLGTSDVLAYRPGRDTVWNSLLATPAIETMPAVSPDGRWLAYASNESGQVEVYVRPFPDVGRGKWQVSLDGGFWPRWAHSGTELFYANISNGFVAAEIRTEPTLSIGRRQVLYSTGTGPFFQVGLDDQQFLRFWSRAATDSASAELVLIQNLPAMLRTRR